MDPEPVLHEIAEAFLRFVHEHPDMPVTLHVRVGESQLELRYRGAELARQGALVFGLRDRRTLAPTGPSGIAPPLRRLV